MPVLGVCLFVSKNRFHIFYVVETFSNMGFQVDDIFSITEGTLTLQRTENSTHIEFVVEKVANRQCLISGFLREVGEVCALMCFFFLGYYAVSSGNSLPTFRDKL